MSAYFSLGANVGDRGGYLRLGVRLVAGDDAHRVSLVYVTEPVGGVAQDDFWNLVLEVDTDDAPSALLARAQGAEEAAGRTREVRWGPRTLDVDVLWVDGVTSDDPEITIPHPRLHERCFALVPLRALRPDLVDEEALARASGRVEVLGTLETLQ